MQLEEQTMVTVGMMLRVEAKPDKADEVEAMLKAGAVKIQDEVTTPIWVALRLGPTTFCVVDAFFDEAGRQTHLDANAHVLVEAAPHLFAGPPTIEYTDVVAAKVPGE
jgi:quinol monooxygenase YgiN